jgi:hypothetical protein
MARLWRALVELLSDVTSRLRPARLEPPVAPKPQREVPEPSRRAAQPPYDLAKDTSTDNQKYLM